MQSFLSTKMEPKVKYEIKRAICTNCGTETDQAVSKYAKGRLICVYCGESNTDEEVPHE